MATLAEAFPEVAEQWHPTKNGGRTPDNTTSRNGYRAWWRCNLGHEWDAIVANRTKSSGGTGCPYCANKRLLVGFNDMGTRFPDLSREWHPTKNGNSAPEDFIGVAAGNVWWLGDCSHEWEATVTNRTFGKGCPYCSHQKVLQGETDVATIAPHLIDQVADPDQDISSMNAYSTSEEIEWRCSDCDHQWFATIKRRAVAGHGCQQCVYLQGWNQTGSSISEMYPEVAEMYHPDKNSAPVSDPSLTTTNKEKLWWRADCGHEWTNAIRLMVRNPSCRVCSNWQVDEGTNSVAAIRPDLVELWHPTKNGSLTPATVYVRSSYPVWWVCEHGHEWQESPLRASRRDRICRDCVPWSLADQYPEVAALWHPTKNGDVTPDDVSGASRDKYWWVCEHGHETYQDVDRKYLHCTTCNRKRSNGEQKVVDYLRSIGVECEQHARGVLPTSEFDRRSEVDIWIPSQRIAIEYNGVYWHSGFVSDMRTYRKMQALRREGIQLLVIWEDDWHHKGDIVRSMLAAKLTDNRRVMASARKMKVDTVSAPELRPFLDSHHIQGFARATHHFVLRDEGDQIRAAMSVVHGAESTEIVRFSSLGVYGSYGKLMRVAERELGVRRWTTLSDNEYTDGGVYRTLGFRQEEQLSPRYWYIVNHRRVNHQRYTKSKMLAKGLLGDQSMTEFQIAKLNNLRRAYDCGRIRWVKEVGSPGEH